MKNQQDICDVQCIHEDAVLAATEKRLPEREYLDLAELFKVMGDPTRLRILHALAQSAMCVCDLTSLLHVSQSAVSHQLRILRGARLVRFTRQGRMAIYELDDSHVRTLLREALEHIRE